MAQDHLDLPLRLQTGQACWLLQISVCFHPSHGGHRLNRFIVQGRNLIYRAITNILLCDTDNLL